MEAKDRVAMAVLVMAAVGLVAAVGPVVQLGPAVTARPTAVQTVTAGIQEVQELFIISHSVHQVEETAEPAVAVRAVVVPQAEAEAKDRLVLMLLQLIRYSVTLELFFLSLTEWTVWVLATAEAKGLAVQTARTVISELVGLFMVLAAVVLRALQAPVVVVVKTNLMTADLAALETRAVTVARPIQAA